MEEKEKEEVEVEEKEEETVLQRGEETCCVHVAIAHICKARGSCH